MQVPLLDLSVLLLYEFSLQTALQNKFRDFIDNKKDIVPERINLIPIDRNVPNKVPNPDLVAWAVVRPAIMSPITAPSKVPSIIPIGVNAIPSSIPIMLPIIPCFVAPNFSLSIVESYSPTR